MSNSSLGGSSSGGDVVGPGSATDEDIVVFDGTSGKLIKDSGVKFPIPEASGGTNQTTYTQGDILYSSATNTIAKLNIGDPSDILMSDSNGVPIWKTPNYIYFEDDFLLGNALWKELVGGSGSGIAQIAGELYHPGLLRVTVAGTGASVLRAENQVPIYLSGGRIQYDSIVRVNSLSDGTDTYNLTIGLGDAFNNTSHNEGAYFYYTHTTNSGNWVGITKSGASTSVNSSIAVSAGTWIKLTIVINAAASSCEFFIDDVSIGSSSTNLPTDGGLHFAIDETVGTGAKTFDIDYVRFYQELSTDRF